VVVGTAFIGACGRDMRSPPERVAVSSAALTSPPPGISFDLVFPSNLGLNSVALGASQDLILGSADQIQAVDGSPGTIANAGGGIVQIGDQTQVGDIVSTTDIEFGDEVTAKSARSSGNVSLGDGDTVPTVVQNATLTPLVHTPLTVFPPQGTPSDVTVPATGAKTLAPGVYGKVNVGSGAVVTVSAGNYAINTLKVASGATLKLDTTGGNVNLYVTASANWNGTVSGDASRFLFALVGQGSSVIFGNAFRGTVLAPFGLLQFAPSTSPYEGTYYGQEVIVGSGVTIRELPPANLAVLRLQQDTGTPWVVSQRQPAASELSTYLRPTGDPGVALPAGTKPGDAATAFLQKYADIFSIQNPATELALRDGHIDPSGIGYAGFRQVVNGVPVLGAGATVMFKANGRIDSIANHYIPGVLGLSTTPTIDAAAALASAQADLATRFPPGTLGASLPSEPAVLFVAQQGTGGARLVYHVAAIFAGQADQTIHFSRNYVIDASTGSVLSSVDGKRMQYIGPGVPVQASGQGTIEQIGKLPLVRQFTAFSSTPPNGPPFYMQPSTSPPIFVLTPGASGQAPNTVSSNKLNSWDTGGFVPGAAVDAYVYLNYILNWWSVRGRSSYDNNGAMVKVVVHDPDPELLNGNAAWESNDRTFHVGESVASLQYPASVAVDTMGHEFQHAVNTSVFNIETLISNGDVDAAPLNESLGDVFGQFIEHGFSLSAPLSYKSSPDLAGEGKFAAANLPNGWTRNLRDPHSPGQFQPAGPDSFADCLYDPNNKDVHVNAGIPNRAWSLATFGGIDSTTGVGVDVSIELGMSQSEQFYLMLVTDPPTLGSSGIGEMYHQLGQALTGYARMLFNDLSDQERAIACAWYGVSVFTFSDMALLGFNPSLDCAMGPNSPCTSAGAAAPTQASCGGGGGTLSSCPFTPCQNAAAGPACSTDGSTLYTCDGNGGTVGGTLCSGGCLASSVAFAACAAGTTPVGGGGGPCSFLLDGTYCGGNGSGNTNILYTCSGGNIAGATSCGNGCQINTVPGGSASPPPPPPGCSGAGIASCAGLAVGNYCGNDLVCGNPNILYHCDLNGDISVTMACPTGCSILSSGSQAGGSDNCTGPFDTRAGTDSCRPGSQTPVGPGSAQNNCPAGHTPPNCCPVGEGPCAVSNGAVGAGGSNVQCNPTAAGFPGPNLADGLYCSFDRQTATACQGGVNKGTFGCPSGCTFVGGGKDQCPGSTFICAGLADGVYCDDPKTATVCKGGLNKGTFACPSGCGGPGGGQDECVGMVSTP
jgi:Zn-dependent metalloprotease